MDRRQQKTRKAIFEAFQALLEKKRYDRITVQEIIDEANVGRSTFYAHFETKEALLDAFCGEVFFHLFGENACAFTGSEDTLEGKLTHILWHIRDSQNNLSAILRSDGREVFFAYFKEHMTTLFATEWQEETDLPRDYRLRMLAAGFVETLVWWAEEKYQAEPEAVAGGFLRLYGGA
jgi:AcrR family transcriptional regulator